MAKEKNKTELPQVMEGELQARLIKLREDAGFDIPQMATAMCLSEEVVVNLENEAFDLLPEPPYVRGYLRNYAKLSDSNSDDENELITRYEALRGADASELDFQAQKSKNIAEVSKKRISPVWGQLILLGLLIGALALIFSIPGVNSWVSEKWQGFSSQLSQSDPRNNPELIGSLPVPTPLGNELTIPPKDLTTTDSNTTTAANQNTNNQTANTDEAQTSDVTSNSNEATSTTDAATVESTSTETNTESATANTETTTKAETATSDTQEIASTSADGIINIKLVFNKEVWLRIKDKDNKTVFEGLNKAATEKTLDLKKPLTFRVGNAQGLALFIDGKAVDINSYTNGSIANFTLE